MTTASMSPFSLPWDGFPERVTSVCLCGSVTFVNLASVSLRECALCSDTPRCD